MQAKIIENIVDNKEDLLQATEEIKTISKLKHPNIIKYNSQITWKMKSVF